MSEGRSGHCACVCVWVCVCVCVSIETLYIVVPRACREEGTRNYLLLLESKHRSGWHNSNLKIDVY